MATISKIDLDESGRRVAKRRRILLEDKNSDKNLRTLCEQLAWGHRNVPAFLSRVAQILRKSREHFVISTTNYEVTNWDVDDD